MAKDKNGREIKIGDTVKLAASSASARSFYAARVVAIDGDFVTVTKQGQDHVPVHVDELLELVA